MWARYGWLCDQDHAWWWLDAVTPAARSITIAVAGQAVPRRRATGTERTAERRERRGSEPREGWV